MEAIGNDQGSRRSARIAARVSEEVAEKNDSEGSELCSILEDVMSFEKGIKRNKSQSAAMQCSDVSKKHEIRGAKLEAEFIASISDIKNEDGKQKWEDHLVLVKNQNYVPGPSAKKMVPKLFSILSGSKTKAKIQLCNLLLVDWQMDVKLATKVKEGDCPWKQPSTQNTEFRSFLSHMNKKYGWEYKDSDFKNFEGAVNGVLSNLYKERQVKWVSTLVLIFKCQKSSLILMKS